MLSRFPILIHDENVIRHEINLVMHTLMYFVLVGMNFAEVNLFPICRNT